MSRIGKKIITIPEKVEINFNNGDLSVKGPLGTVTRHFKDDIKITIENGEITFLPVKDTNFTKALWGTYASHVINMIEGVTKGFEKKMLIEGIGFKINVVGTNVVLDIGLSHDVKVPIPTGVKVVVEKNNFNISGFDKEVVGQFAAKIRSLKRTEPYKGKGIRYIDEFVRRKQGKKTAA